MSAARPVRLLAPLAAAGCILAIAGCGSSGHTGTGSSRGATMLAFSKCMRSHGLTGFPDPSPGGSGLNLDGTGIDPTSPAFRAARGTCRKLLPGGGPGSGHATEQQKQQMLATSQCMRRHGVTAFPDPTTKPPSGIRDYSIVEGVAGDLFLLVPKTIDVNSPAFRQAAKACKFG